MRLDELLNEAGKGMSVTVSVNNMKAAVEGVTDNTEEVAEGFVFVCIRGAHFDGHDFAEQALEKGALCVVADCDLFLDNQIIVPDTRVFYGHLCAAWFNHPERRMKLIGVTGTNGKTTLATMIKEILAAKGHRVGFIGTTGSLINGKPVQTDGSTPTPPRVFELYKHWYDIAKSVCGCVVMEGSSVCIL
ncbi:MAG: hypothetical protein K2J72_06845 [Oscillospiraceae bacterium]|nr:hypothetical protein [Oscillospiraceae bacterium]